MMVVGSPVDIQERQVDLPLKLSLQCFTREEEFGGGYKVSGGLHGVGSSVVNALSTSLDVRVYKMAVSITKEYRRGHVVDDLKIIGETDRTGTTVHFIPDPEIFHGND